MPLQWVPKGERDYLKRATCGGVVVLALASVVVWLHAHGGSEDPAPADYLPGALIVLVLAVLIVGTIIVRYRFFRSRARRS